MINLEPLLSPWVGIKPWVFPFPDWSEDEAYSWASALGKREKFTVEWDSANEEWMIFVGKEDVVGMCSIYFPIALVLEELVGGLTGQSLVEYSVITGFDDENLCCSQEVLVSTVARYGLDADFNPDAFCARDLFIQSV